MLGQDSLRAAVAASGVAVAPVWLDETDSTNAEAARLAEAGAPEWTVVATGHQTAGRGRLGRSWEDVPGRSLLFSVLLRPRVPPEDAPLFTLLAAVEMIAASGLPSMGSKWPNDLVVGDRKCGGILAEARARAGAIEHLVLGIGVNVEDHPAPEAVEATSLAAEGGQADAGALLARFLGAFRAAVSDSAFPDGVADRYSRVCTTVGRRVRATASSGRVVEGVATGLDGRAGLIVDVGGGMATLSFGEVVHLR